MLATWKGMVARDLEPGLGRPGRAGWRTMANRLAAEVEALRASAPEMLEALRMIAEYDTDEHHEYTDEWTEAASFNVCQALARAAIARAEGRETP